MPTEDERKVQQHIDILKEDHANRAGQVLGKIESEAVMAKGMPREARMIRRYGQSFKVLAEEGMAKDWAAYAEDEYTRSLGNSDDAIHDSGSKLSHSEAASAFPNWEEGPLVWRR